MYETWYAYHATRDHVNGAVVIPHISNTNITASQIAEANLSAVCMCIRGEPKDPALVLRS
jgi:hypothetical protein